MISARPAVSVLVTAYNRAAFIRASIESVLQQTFTDFELVIVDDCSTDDTLAIARAYERRDSRVRVVANERNLGQFPNRNHAATLARGQFLKFHDSDDVMYPHCLEVMVSMLRAEPLAGFGLSAGHTWPGGPCPMLLTPSMAYQREFFGGGLFSCGPGGSIFRAEAFSLLGGFPLLGPHSDVLMWLHACKTTSCVLMPADLFWYRVHSGQHLQTEAGQHDALPLFRAFWEALDAADCPLTAEEREQAKRNATYKLARKVLQDLRGRRWSFAAERIRVSAMRLKDWLRYLRPPRRNEFAGTPLTPDGDFITPARTTPVERSPKRSAS
jgi:glycosyltransferase involved in cell wall biosynthesis